VKTITVVLRKDISFSDIVKLNPLRSAHIGNQYPTNLLLLQHGVKTILYDRNLIGDKNYHPNSVIVGGNNIKMTQSPMNLLSPYGVIDSAGLKKIGIKNKHQTIAQLHYDMAKKVFPKTDIKTFSEYILTKEHLLKNVLSAVIEYRPDYFNRFILKSGKILSLSTIDGKYLYYTDNVESRKILKSETVANAINFTKNLKTSIVDKSGIIGENEGCIWNGIVTVLLCIVMESAGKASPCEIWHLSGPDMVKYVLQCESELNTLYEATRNLCNGALPQILEFNVVPTATALRLFCKADKYVEARSIFSLLETKESLEKEKREKIKNAGKNTEAIIHEYTKKIHALRRKIADRLSGVPEMFYDLSKGAFPTQYDIATDTNNTPILHAIAKKQTIHELERQYNYLEKIYLKICCGKSN